MKNPKISIITVVKNNKKHIEKNILSLLNQKYKNYEHIIIDGKSGVSGAGRSLSLNTHFAEVNESIKAYSLNGHRHLPEIIQELEKLNKSSDLKITFLTLSNHLFRVGSLRGY